MSLKYKYEQFCDFMQQNTKGVEIGIYSVSGILFAVSYLKIRPITKFTKPGDIPKHFITKKVLQNGVIKAIEPNQNTGALLRIDHRPPLNLFFTSHKTLPVKIFGIEVNSNGYSWLQSITLNHKIQFLPIHRENRNFAECQVKLLQDPALHAKPSLDLAESLLSLGFARIADSTDPVLSTDEQIKRYYEKLQKTQTKAKQRRLGLWAALIPPPPWPLVVLKSRLSKAVYDKLLPAKYRLPELVR